MPDSTRTPSSADHLVRRSQRRTIGGGESSATDAWADAYQVDALGVAAVWVETIVATTDQPTLIYFPDAGQARGTLAAGQLPASILATATGARVLVVDRRPASDPLDAGAVEDGLDAYAWLLGEGCETGRTAFVGDPPDGARAVGVLLAASASGLPLPGVGVWCLRPGMPLAHYGRPSRCGHQHFRSRLIQVGAAEIVPFEATAGGLDTE